MQRGFTLLVSLVWPHVIPFCVQPSVNRCTVCSCKNVDPTQAQWTPHCVSGRTCLTCASMVASRLSLACLPACLGYCVHLLAGFSLQCLTERLSFPTMQKVRTRCLRPCAVFAVCLFSCACCVLFARSVFFETVTPHRDIAAVLASCMEAPEATDESTIKV